MRNLFLVFFLVLTSVPTIAAEKNVSAEHGKKLHAESCVSCHISMTGGDGSTLYTRSDRKINSRISLETQVQRCATNTNLSWFEDDVNSVAEYLDKTWYQFAK